MTTILSFDVGIINLSYCILSYDLFINNDGSHHKNWNIIEWNIIDLTNRSNELCYCGKKASLSHIIDENIIYYCKVHSRNVEVKIDTFCNDYNKINDTDKKCCYNSKKECVNKVSYCENKNNKYFCSIHAKLQFKNENKEKEIKNIKKSHINFDDIKFKIISELDKRKHFLNINYIIIENQPSFKNPKMKSIASTIYDYYLIRGIFDKQINNSNVLQVKFQSPSNKLKLISDADKEELTKLKNDSKIYKFTKNLSIKYCEELINHLPSMLEYFNNNKKKDDLADSFLQGVYFYNSLYKKK